MGIRYYGWAVSSDEVVDALRDPWPIIRRADERHDHEGWTNTGLDKAWGPFQRLFDGDDRQRPRPGRELVAGDVTYPRGVDEGYEPHIGVIAVDRVPAIARDLAATGAEDIRRLCEDLHYLGDDERRRSKRDYLTYFLAAAQEFTADAAARGHGIVYLIG